MTARLVDDIQPFLDQVLDCCPMIRAIWLVGDAPGGKPDATRLYAWDLIALADPLTLQRLRRAVKLHRSDVRLRVLDNGNRLETAWGGDARHGVRVATDWQPSAPSEGHYTERAAPDERLPASRAEGTRRKAICLWQGIDPIKGPGS